MTAFVQENALQRCTTVNLVAVKKLVNATCFLQVSKISWVNDVNRLTSTPRDREERGRDPIRQCLFLPTLHTIALLLAFPSTALLYYLGNLLGLARELREISLIISASSGELAIVLL